MRARFFTSALFRLLNIGILMIGVGAAYTVAGLVPGSAAIVYPAAVLAYLISVVASMNSKAFMDEFKRNERVKNIKALDSKCAKLADEAKKYANNTYLQKLLGVLDDKSDITASYFRDQGDYLKERVVEKTLNLVISFEKLLTNFCIRKRELSEVDLGQIVKRINDNARRLNYTSDPEAADDIKKVIEIDQKILMGVKEEKLDLERINTKLDYMCSTIDMFKFRILSSIETEDMLDTLDNAVNEAQALDNVLAERRRYRVSG